MKMFQRLLGIVLVAAASAGLLVACGDDDDSCIDSNDCASEERCNLDTETCGFACEVGGGDCLDDEICEEVGDGGGVCVFVGEDNNGDNNGAECTEETEETDCLEDEICVGGTCVVEDECNTNEDCEGENDCIEGVCETPDPSEDYNFARIADVSDTDDSNLCGSGVSDPGADIYGVELIRGDTSYWARFEYDGDIETDGNNYDSPVGVIEGEPLGLDDDCPEFDTDSIVSLGCGGSMIVSFVDENGERQFFEDGDDIRVYEYGSQCNTEDSQDSWEVAICDSSSDYTSGECAGEVVVGSGTADTSVTVNLGDE